MTNTTDRTPLAAMIARVHDIARSTAEALDGVERVAPGCDCAPLVARASRNELAAALATGGWTARELVDAARERTTARWTFFHVELVLADVLEVA